MPASSTHQPPFAWSTRLPGGVLCVAIAAMAWWLGHLAPVVGGAVFALVIGIAVNNLLRLPSTVRPGVAWTAKKVLQAAIVVLGGSLSGAQLVAAGRVSLGVMLITLGVALVTAWLLGRWLGVSRNLTALVGVGTAICGGSAIAAVAPILAAEDDEIAFSISTVFLFNLVAVLVFPLLGHALGLSQTGFGIWAGTAINDTSSVVAAALAYGRAALDVATVTKLARTTMIVPVALGVLWWVTRQRADGRSTDQAGVLRRIFPWFILGFVALSLLNSSGWLGPQFPHWAGLGGRVLIVVALAGVGLGTDLRKLAATGARPILLGLLTWIIVAVSSLVVQRAGGQW